MCVCVNTELTASVQGSLGFSGPSMSCFVCVYHYSQFIVNLDGDVAVEVSSGEKRVITAGEVFFVEDVTGQLHFSLHQTVDLDYHILHLG